MNSSDDIETQVRSILVKNFELQESSVTPEATLFVDLDLDSLDAIDLAVKLESETGIKLAESEFQAIRTVQDVVDTIRRKLAPEQAV